jgi:endonuclease-3
MKKNVESILQKLKEMHGMPRVELNFTNPLELIVATVLSAQCTDARVNKVTETLFKKYATLEDYAHASLEVFEEEIRPTGYYRNKAKSITGIAREIIERFEGHIPEDIDTFATIKGIGRKSANMVVGLAFGKPALIVDTHVSRVSQRIGLTESKDPNRIEQDLRQLLPAAERTAFSLLTILHGRRLCKAGKPQCESCLMGKDCDYLTGQK